MSAPLDNESAIAADYSSGQTIKQLAVKYRISQPRIRKILQKYGVQRTKSEAIRLAVPNRKKREIVKSPLCKMCGAARNWSLTGVRMCDECFALYQSKRSLKARTRFFGITIKEYEDFLTKQGGTCAICNRNDPRGHGTWHIDHDHETGKVRGLLCYTCNVGLGYFEEKIVNLQRAIAYLKIAKTSNMDGQTHIET